MRLEREDFRGLLNKIQNISELGLFIKKFLQYYVVQKILLAVVRLNVTHISGPAKVNYNPDELVVLCLVRNGELYLNSFMAHYAALGVKHVVFLDNNSTDATVTMARQYPNVTILQSKLPYKRYKLVMKEYLIKRFGQARWTLCVDIDELFDYPYSETISLQALLTYLNKNSYTAVVAQMLDMFSAEPLANLKSTKNDSLKTLYNYYDVSNITRIYYYFRNTNSNNIELYYGGIRNTLFGIVVEPYGFMLTKHPLIFLDHKLKPMFLVDHVVRNANLADFTGVLFHYKFLGNFYERASLIAQEENYYQNSVEYKRYLEVFNHNPNLQIKQKTSRKINNVNDLIDNEFLVVSQDYMNWASEDQANR